MNGKQELDIRLDSSIRQKIKRYPVIVTMYYDWLIDNGKSYRTGQAYIETITNFLDYRFGTIVPNAFHLLITPSDISAYLESLQAKSKNSSNTSASNAAKAASWSALNSFFQFLVPNYLTKNPVSDIDRPTIDKKVERAYLTPEDTHKLLDNVWNLANIRMVNRDLCILMLGFYCGFSSSDIVQVNMSDIDWETREISKISSKGSHYLVPFSTETEMYLHKWIEDREKYFLTDTDALFISQEKKRISARTLKDLLDRYSEGINKHITPQVMRNTCIVNLYKETGDLNLCATLLNQSANATHRYIEQIDSSISIGQAINIMDSVYGQQTKNDTCTLSPLARKIIQNAEIAELGFTARLKHFLLRADIRTIGELCTWHNEELAKIPCITAQDIDDIEAKLEEVGLCLSPQKLKFPLKNDEWFSNIKWDKSCIMCQRETNGVCKKRSCAEEYYDPWGDPLPAYLWRPDGNDVERYLIKKLRQKASEN